MNSQSIVASAGVRKTLILPISAAVSASTENERDSSEISNKKNLPKPIRFAKRSNALRAELSENGGFCMFPLELCQRKWPSSRLRIFAFIMGAPDSRIISIRDVMSATGICPSTIKGELSHLCQDGYLSPQSVTIRTKNGMRQMTTWDVNPRSQWVENNLAGDPDTSNPPGRKHDLECNDAVEEESMQQKAFSEPCQTPQSADADTHKEEGNKTKNKTPVGNSESRTGAHLWQVNQTKEKPKSPFEKKTVPKDDLVGLMRALYDRHSSTAAIKGCIAFLISEFDRDVILETVLRYVEASKGSMKWEREDLRAWRSECQRTLQAREPARAANG